MSVSKTFSLSFEKFSCVIYVVFDCLVTVWSGSTCDCIRRVFILCGTVRTSHCGSLLSDTQQGWLTNNVLVVYHEKFFRYVHDSWGVIGRCRVRVIRLVSLWVKDPAWTTMLSLREALRGRTKGWSRGSRRRVGALMGTTARHILGLWWRCMVVMVDNNTAFSIWSLPAACVRGHGQVRGIYDQRLLLSNPCCADCLASGRGLILVFIVGSGHVAGPISVNLQLLLLSFYSLICCRVIPANIQGCWRLWRSVCIAQLVACRDLPSQKGSISWLLLFVVPLIYSSIVYFFSPSIRRSIAFWG